MAFQSIEPVADFILPNRRANACPLAQIELGRHGPGWVNCIGFQQDGGDCWGSWEPMGFWPGQEPCTTFATHDAALADAIDRMRSKLAGRPREMAQQIAWLDTLVPDQPDLFYTPQHRAAA